jgi:hypothetical protein
MSERENVERVTVYYQEFHHKCLTWYITIMGFLIAAAVAAPKATNVDTEKALGAALMLVAVFCGVFFLACIAHYGARIKLLTQWLEGNPDQIPTDWRTKHKDVGGAIHGVGSAFFVTILIGMQVALLYLVVLRCWP